MKKMVIYPSEQRVIVLPEKSDETRRPSGIIIPVTADDKRAEVAEVVAVGMGSAEYPMKYYVGEKVIYSQYAGVEVKMNLDPHGEQVYKVMNQLDIMGTIQIID